MLIYAISADLTDATPPWLTSLPANVGSLLRSASLLVRSTTVTAYYTVDNTGMPTDATVLQAFKDATCAQVTCWVGLGIDPLNLGLDGKAPTRSKQLDGAAIAYDTAAAVSQAAFAARQAAAVTLCEQSQEILREAGVLLTRVWTYG